MCIHIAYVYTQTLHKKHHINLHTNAHCRPTCLCVHTVAHRIAHENLHSIEHIYVGICVCSFVHKLCLSTRLCMCSGIAYAHSYAYAAANNFVDNYVHILTHVYAAHEQLWLANLVHQQSFVFINTLVLTLTRVHKYTCTNTHTCS